MTERTKRRKQLTKEDRYYIEIALKKHIAVSEIARDLHRHRSTIYKEIRRGQYEHLDAATWETTQRYGYDVGQRVIDANRHNKGRRHKLAPDCEYFQKIRDYVVNRKYSPEAAQIKLGEHLVSKTTLYNCIRAGYIPGMSVQSLPYAKPKKQKKHKTGKTVSRGTSIEKRPPEVLEREEYGHWEMDTVYSSHDDLSCILALTERQSRKSLLFKLPNRTAGAVLQALNKLERKIGTPAFRETFKTITCDNGVEFSDWQNIEKSCRIKGNRTTVYFCHPYSSYERGSNENENRLIRRWIPKGDDIGLYSDKEIQAIQDWINNYPRQLFGGLSSLEFLELNN